MKELKMNGMKFRIVDGRENDSLLGWKTIKFIEKSIGSTSQYTNSDGELVTFYEYIWFVLVLNDEGKEEFTNIIETSILNEIHEGIYKYSP